MKIKLISIVLMTVLLLGGCSMEMSADDRIRMLYGTQESGMGDDVMIHEPEDDEFPKLTVGITSYSLEFLADLFLQMSPEEVQKVKKNDDMLLIEESEENFAGIITGDDIGLRFQANLDAHLYYETLVGIYVYAENQTNVYSNLNLKKIFAKEELPDFPLEEAERLCNAYVEKLGFPVSSYNAYAIDVDSINAIKEESVRQPALGYRRDEEGNWTGEQGTGIQGSYYFVYHQSYRNTSVEGCELVICCNKDGIIMAQTMDPMLTDQIIQEESVDLLSGKEAFASAQSVLNNMGVDVDQIDELSISYMYSTWEKNSEAHTTSLIPVWKVSYHQEVNGQMLSDFILLDGVTGDPTSGIPQN